MHQRTSGRVIAQRLPKLLAFCCLIAVISSCAGEHHRFTATASPPPSIDPDTLIVSVEDVARIAHFDDLTSDPQLDRRAPGDLDAQSPAPCRAVFDQQAAFGEGWTRFRSVWYSGANNKGVTQAVAVYPSDDAARNAFDRVSSALTACSALHADGFDFTTRKPSASTVSACFEQCRVMYRWKSSVLIDVSVQHFSDSERIANEVANAIADRINSA